jgi:hypothetical protein
MHTPSLVVEEAQLWRESATAQRAPLADFTLHEIQSPSADVS